MAVIPESGLEPSALRQDAYTRFLEIGHRYQRVASMGVEDLPDTLERMALRRERDPGNRAIGETDSDAEI